MLLLRATILTERVEAFADELARESGETVALALDGRHRIERSTAHPVLAVTAEACAEAGLWCPSNFAWRCGDYPMYLARRHFPDQPYVWQIEYDVRFSPGLAREFFGFFKDVSCDLLAPDLEPAGKQWTWYHHCRGRDVTTYKCFFPVIRLSARALDLLSAKRGAHARSAQRRDTWPNDEGFVATSLMQAGLDCRHLNSFGPRFYGPETFTFERPIEGEVFETGAPQRGIYHPVLFGADFRRKVAVLERGRRGRGIKSYVRDLWLPFNRWAAW